MNASTPLKFENLTYGLREPVFQNASLVMRPREIVTLVVEKAAVRAALTDCLCGNLKPTGGRIQFWGRENRGFQRDEIQQKVGWILSKKESFAPWIRAGEYLSATGRLFRNWNSALCQELVEKLGLDLNRRMSDLSPEEALKIRFIKALAFEPELVVLDEFVADVSDDERRLVIDVLLEQFTKGEMAILIISANGRDSEPFSTRVVTLSNNSVTQDVGAPL